MNPRSLLLGIPLGLLIWAGLVGLAIKLKAAAARGELPVLTWGPR